MATYPYNEDGIDPTARASDDTNFWAYAWFRQDHPEENLRAAVDESSNALERRTSRWDTSGAPADQQPASPFTVTSVAHMSGRQPSTAASMYSDDTRREQPVEPGVAWASGALRAKKERERGDEVVRLPSEVAVDKSHQLLMRDVKGGVSRYAGTPGEQRVAQDPISNGQHAAELRQRLKAARYRTRRASGSVGVRAPKTSGTWGHTPPAIMLAEHSPSRSTSAASAMYPSRGASPARDDYASIAASSRGVSAISSASGPGPRRKPQPQVREEKPAWVNPPGSQCTQTEPFHIMRLQLQLQTPDARGVSNLEQLADDYYTAAGMDYHSSESGESAVLAQSDVSEAPDEDVMEEVPHSASGSDVGIDADEQPVALPVEEDVFPEEEPFELVINTPAPPEHPTAEDDSAAGIGADAAEEQPPAEVQREVQPEPEPQTVEPIPEPAEDPAEDPYVTAENTIAGQSILAPVQEAPTFPDELDFVPPPPPPPPVEPPKPDPIEEGIQTDPIPKTPPKTPPPPIVQASPEAIIAAEAAAASANAAKEVAESAARANAAELELMQQTVAALQAQQKQMAAWSEEERTRRDAELKTILEAQQRQQEIVLANEAARRRQESREREASERRKELQSLREEQAELLREQRRRHQEMHDAAHAKKEASVSREADQKAAETAKREMEMQRRELERQQQELAHAVRARDAESQRMQHQLTHQQAELERQRADWAQRMSHEAEEQQRTQAKHFEQQQKLLQEQQSQFLQAQQHQLGKHQRDEAALKQQVAELASLQNAQHEAQRKHLADQQEHLHGLMSQQQDVLRQALESPQPRVEVVTVPAPAPPPPPPAPPTPRDSQSTQTTEPEPEPTPATSLADEFRGAADDDEDEPEPAKPPTPQVYEAGAFTDGVLSGLSNSPIEMPDRRLSVPAARPPLHLYGQDFAAEFYRLRENYRLVRLTRGQPAQAETEGVEQSPIADRSSSVLRDAGAQGAGRYVPPHQTRRASGFQPVGIPAGPPSLPSTSAVPSSPGSLERFTPQPFNGSSQPHVAGRVATPSSVADQAAARLPHASLSF